MAGSQNGPGERAQRMQGCQHGNSYITSRETKLAELQSNGPILLEVARAQAPSQCEAVKQSAASVCLSTERPSLRPPLVRPQDAHWCVAGTAASAWVASRSPTSVRDSKHQTLSQREALCGSQPGLDWVNIALQTMLTEALAKTMENPVEAQR